VDERRGRRSLKAKKKTRVAEKKTRGQKDRRGEGKQKGKTRGTGAGQTARGRRGEGKGAGQTPGLRFTTRAEIICFSIVAEVTLVNSKALVLEGVSTTNLVAQLTTERDSTYPNEGEDGGEVKRRGYSKGRREAVTMEAARNNFWTYKRERTLALGAWKMLWFQGKKCFVEVDLPRQKDDVSSIGRKGFVHKPTGALLEVAINLESLSVECLLQVDQDDLEMGSWTSRECIFVEEIEGTVNASNLYPVPKDASTFVRFSVMPQDHLNYALTWICTN
ncbi:hypothetical protein KI387_005784, partial [Taxus chinensis]